MEETCAVLAQRHAVVERGREPLDVAPRPEVAYDEFALVLAAVAHGVDQSRRAVESDTSTSSDVVSVRDSSDGSISFS